MSVSVQVFNEPDMIVVRIPLKVRKRGGRKLMIATGSTAAKPARMKTNDAILKALARAHRWKRMLESGEFASIGDLAAAEKINHSYIRRVLRLTLLSPTVIERILDGTLRRDIQLENLLKPFPNDWATHADWIG